MLCATSIAFFLPLLSLARPIDDAPSIPSSTARPKKVADQKVKYTAAFDAVRLDFENGVYKYGYSTDDHFKTEERKPDGSVSGYYGFIDKNGKPVRYKYSASATKGYQVKKEAILAKIAAQTTTDDSPLHGVKIDSEKTEDDTGIVVDNEDLASVDPLSRLTRDTRRIVVQQNPGEPDILVADPREKFILKAVTGFSARGAGIDKSRTRELV